jgi:hypothetical protein
MTPKDFTPENTEITERNIFAPGSLCAQWTKIVSSLQRNQAAYEPRGDAIHHRGEENGDSPRSKSYVAQSFDRYCSFHAIIVRVVSTHADGSNEKL